MKYPYNIYDEEENEKRAKIDEIVEVLSENRDELAKHVKNDTTEEYAKGQTENFDEKMIDLLRTKFQMKAIQKFGADFIEDIPNPSYDAVEKAIEIKMESSENNDFIRKIEKNLSDDIKIDLIKYGGYNLVRRLSKSMDNPSEEIQLELVKINGTNIYDLKNPTEAVKFEAVKNSPSVILHFENPSEELKIESVKGDAFLLGKFKNPSNELIVEAVKSDGRAIQYVDVEKRTDELRFMAIESNPSSIEFMKDDATEEMKLLAVSKNYDVYDLIVNPSEEVTAEYMRPRSVDDFLSDGEIDFWDLENEVDYSHVDVKDYKDIIDIWPGFIRNMPDASEKDKWTAIRKNPNILEKNAIGHFNGHSYLEEEIDFFKPEMLEFMYEDNPDLLRDISVFVIERAIEYDGPAGTLDKLTGFAKRMDSPVGNGIVKYIEMAGDILDNHKDFKNTEVNSEFFFTDDIESIFHSYGFKDISYEKHETRDTPEIKAKDEMYEKNEDLAHLIYEGYKNKEFFNDPNNYEKVKEIIAIHPTSIRLIENPSSELQELSISKSKVAIYGIEKPSPRAIELHNSLYDEYDKYEEPSDTFRTYRYECKQYDDENNFEKKLENVSSQVENRNENEFDEAENIDDVE